MSSHRDQSDLFSLLLVLFVFLNLARLEVLELVKFSFPDPLYFELHPVDVVLARSVERVGTHHLVFEVDYSHVELPQIHH